MIAASHGINTQSTHGGATQSTHGGATKFFTRPQPTAPILHSTHASMGQDRTSIDSQYPQSPRTVHARSVEPEQARSIGNQRRSQPQMHHQDWSTLSPASRSDTPYMPNVDSLGPTSGDSPTRTYHAELSQPQASKHHTTWTTSAPSPRPSAPSSMPGSSAPASSLWVSRPSQSSEEGLSARSTSSVSGLVSTMGGGRLSTGRALSASTSPDIDDILRRLRSRSPNSKEGVAACDYCRKRKIRCDRQKPSCGRCTAQGRMCTTADALRKRGPPSKKDLELLAAQGLQFVPSRQRRKSRRDSKQIGAIGGLVETDKWMDDIAGPTTSRSQPGTKNEQAAVQRRLARAAALTGDSRQHTGKTVPQQPAGVGVQRHGDRPHRSSESDLVIGTGFDDLQWQVSDLSPTTNIEPHSAPVQGSFGLPWSTSPNPHFASSNAPLLSHSPHVAPTSLPTQPVDMHSHGSDSFPTSNYSPYTMQQQRHSQQLHQAQQAQHPSTLFAQASVSAHPSSLPEGDSSHTWHWG